MKEVLGGGKIISALKLENAMLGSVDFERSKKQHALLQAKHQIAL